ncbi:MAG: prepilin-type N-terminal cleavage/methylation domain-containing protein [Planctomycetes bacterium]|nr:prepilin-type N-terminal cleavage/methylation domain-containing protein [Planctomycetota bacterium]
MKNNQKKQLVSPVKTDRKQGFTLIEILIVVIILGILASIVIPGLSNTSMEAKKNMLQENLRVMQEQIGIYRAQHWDVSPGYPDGDTTAAPTEAEFVAQLTNYSDEDGVTNDTWTARFRYGFYLRKMPENPINGLSTVQVLADADAVPAPDNSHGWIFKPGDLVFIADSLDN